MRRSLLLTSLLLTATAPLLSGCIAALPLAAAGMMGKATLDRRGADRTASAIPRARPVASGRSAAPRETTLSAAAVAALDGVRATTPGLPATTGAIRSDLDIESGAPWAQMTDYALGEARQRATGGDVPGAVLRQGSPLDEPVFVPCGDKPLAVLVDLDGAGALAKPLDARSVPAATTAAAVRLHTGGVAIAWLSDRPAGTAGEVRQALTKAGLWADGDRLLLDNGRRKQERRWDASQDLCVVAQLGDTASDMDELFDYLRDPNDAEALDALFNQRWFLAPPTIATSN